MAAITVQKHKKIANKRERRRLAFYVCMFAIPLLQFVVFYLFVNFNSIIIAFQSFTPVTDESGAIAIGYNTNFVGFDNFVVAWNKLFSPSSAEMIKFSFIFYACNLLIVTPLALVFSYYIAKKYRFSSFFRVMLYLPCVLSAVVLALIYKLIVTDVFKTDWFTASQDSQFKVILFYNLFLAYGTNTMLYTGAMSDINPSLIEASKLDGANGFNQFIHVYIPMIWPTLTTFIVTGLAGLFIEQMQIYTFFGESGSNLFDTFGFFFYNQSIQSDMYSSSIKFLSYPQLAALGILVTVFLIPVVLLVRKLLIKYGPSSK